MGKKALTMHERRNDIGIVRFETSQVLDELNVQQLGDELRDLVEKEYLVRIILNFERVKFLSSAVLGKIISLHKRLGKEKGRMALCSINKDVKQVFKITRLDKLIPIFDTEDEALARIQSPSWPK
jgi:anti-sigma B factor antagonist